MLTSQICEKVTASPLWAIMADEATDRAQREQLAIIVRYLDIVDGKHIIREDPVRLIDVFDHLEAADAEEEIKLSGENLARTIIEIIERCGLDKNYLIAQCYDGAAAMASDKVGVAVRLQEVAPLAHYYHCAMHGLNLATSQVNRVSVIRNAMATMETVIVFISDSAKRTVVLQRAQKKCSVQQQRLIKLCQTRFIERHVSVQRFCEQFAAIVDALRMMKTWTDGRTSSKANMLLTAISTPEFLVGITVLKKLAALLRPVSLALQQQGADLMQTLELTRASIDALSVLREEEAFEPLMAEAEIMGREVHQHQDVTITKPRVAARSICRPNAGDGLNDAGYYRVNVLLPAVDSVRADMEARFGSEIDRGTHHRQAFALSYLLPKKVTTATWEYISPAWKLYKKILPDVDECLAKSELKVWAALWRRHESALPVSAAATLDCCSPTAFPIIYRLLQVEKYPTSVFKVAYLWTWLHLE